MDSLNFSLQKQILWNFEVPLIKSFVFNVFSTLDRNVEKPADGFMFCVFPTTAKCVHLKLTDSITFHRRENYLAHINSRSIWGMEGDFNADGTIIPNQAMHTNLPEEHIETIKWCPQKRMKKLTMNTDIGKNLSDSSSNIIWHWLMHLVCYNDFEPLRSIEPSTPSSWVAVDPSPA